MNWETHVRGGNQNSGDKAGRGGLALCECR